MLCFCLSSGDLWYEIGRFPSSACLCGRCFRVHWHTVDMWSWVVAERTNLLRILLLALIPAGMDLNSSFFFSKCNTTKTCQGSSCSFYHQQRDIASYLVFSFNFWEDPLKTIFLAMSFDLYLLVVVCTVYHLSASISCFYFFLEAGRVHLVNGTSSCKFGDDFEIDIIYMLFERDQIICFQIVVVTAHRIGNTIERTYVSFKELTNIHF